MSETVHYEGVLTPIERLENETLDEQCKRVLRMDELPYYCDDYIDYVRYEQGDPKEFMVVNDKLFSAVIVDVPMEDGIYKAEYTSDGSIKFEVRYYNGGCSFEEAVDTAIDKIDKPTI